MEQDMHRIKKRGLEQILPQSPERNQPYQHLDLSIQVCGAKHFVEERDWMMAEGDVL
jgi:hypothetical protein